MARDERPPVARRPGRGDMDGPISLGNHSIDRWPSAIRLDADWYLPCLCGRDVVQLEDGRRVDVLTLRPHACRWRPTFAGQPR